MVTVDANILEYGVVSRESTSIGGLELVGVRAIYFVLWKKHNHDCLKITDDFSEKDAIHINR